MKGGWIISNRLLFFLLIFFVVALQRLLHPLLHVTGKPFGRLHDEPLATREEVSLEVVRRAQGVLKVGIAVGLHELVL